MSPHVNYLTIDQDSDDAKRLMGEKQIRRLPVMSRDKRLVGVVAMGDLATKTGDQDVVGATMEDVSQPGKTSR